MLKKSQFTIVSLFNNDEIIIYNALSNAVARVDLQSWEKAERRQTWETHEHSALLVSLGFIVPEEVDEYQVFKFIMVI
ncbi:MAG: hypothetical protein DDT29_01093 [Dehalococcoidia bacterium]|nr:hypothetical protein [Bacillota bacterium]